MRQTKRTKQYRERNPYHIRQSGPSSPWPGKWVVSIPLDDDMLGLPHYGAIGDGRGTINLETKEDAEKMYQDYLAHPDKYVVAGK
jgi:hypothetical protein